MRQEQLPEAQNKERVERLGTAKISKLVLEFAIPSIIGLIVNGLYNIIDSIFMGHGVGNIGQATATIALPIMIIGMAISILIGQGGNALTALRLGAGKHDEAERVIGNTFILMIVAAIICTGTVILLMDPILTISGATKATWEYARTFISIIAGGFIFQFIGMGFNNFIRTAGEPNRALYTMITGTVICVILNYLFVIVLHWGVAGSALATVAGQSVSAGLVLWYFIFSKKAPFKIRKECLGLKGRLVKSILALGSAPFVLQIANAFVTFFLNNQITTLGAISSIGSDAALAALGVVNRVALFVFFPILGVALAVQPLFGYNYGAKKYSRVKKTFILAMIWATALGLFAWAVIYLLPEPIVRLFNITGDLLEFTVNALKVQLFLIPLAGLHVVSTNYFQASGQPLKAMFLSLTRSVLFLIPLLYLFPMIITSFLPGLEALDGLYYAYPASDTLAILTCAIFMLFELRKLNKAIKEQKTYTTATKR